MDLIRKRRQGSATSLSHLTDRVPSLEQQGSSSTAASSPASSLHESKSDFFNSIVPKAVRNIRRVSSPHTMNLPGSSGSGLSGRKLMKSHARVSSYESVQRRGSVTSEEFGRISRASTSLSASSSSSVDWKAQHVERSGPLDADTQALRSKPAYLVITQDYIIKFKSKADASATFPQLGARDKRETFGTPAEPCVVIPLHMIVSVYHAESSRPSFGVDIWWKSQYPSMTFSSTQFFFGIPRERDDYMRHIMRLAKARHTEYRNISYVPLEIEARIKKIFEKDDPGYQGTKPEIFPVIHRAARDEGSSKTADKAKKQKDGSSWFLAVCGNYCLFVEVTKGSELPGQTIEMKHQLFGLVSLDYFQANWTVHEERFVLYFREPFKPAVPLELASRFYRRIAITFMKADKTLKPCWPILWQSMEVFRIPGLPEQQFIVPREDYGGLKRTLDAYLASYQVRPVEWEINWKTVCAPEFRLLPPKSGSYSELQLLAVFRALRYNDYFHSLSFRDINMSGLWDKVDPDGRPNVPFLNRTCLALTENYCLPIRYGSLLHQEIHALVYCSETIRQIDFTNCFPEDPEKTRGSARTSPGLQIITPILNLLPQKLTKCNRLLLSGNPLGSSADLRDLLETIATDGADIQALDVSRCGLCDIDIRDTFEVLLHQGRSLQSLDVSGNLGRIQASIAQGLLHTVTDLRRFNVSGILMGHLDGSLFTEGTLERFGNLQELDLSQYKVNQPTLDSLERYFERDPSSLPSSSLGPRYKRIVLNNCGITGRQAAGLVRAISQHDNVHLYLNGNPLEDGIDDLIRAIGLSRGPTGLHLDMIEFSDDLNYVKLVKALTANRGISYLSLVGTAPTPSPNEPCSTETCEALERFFATNRSVRFLDLSGYSGLLDEGQLGKGFSRSLRGLVSNETITHLRIRNQNLHDDIGTLGPIIQQNRKLAMLDFQDNGWNLTSLQFLVQSLKDNETLLSAPFSDGERERIWRRVLNDLRRLSQPTKKSAQQALHTQEEVLKGMLEKSIVELRGIMQRNVSALEKQSGQYVDLDDSTETAGEPGWPSLELKRASGVVSPKDPVGNMRRQRTTVKSSSLGLGTTVSSPYHVNQDEAALESPVDPLSPLSDGANTPELQSPSTPPDLEMSKAVDLDPDWQQAFSRFKIGGLDTHEEE